MSRHFVRIVYILVAVVVSPLLAWYLAVDATNHGFGARGFFIMLLGVPVSGAVLAATLLGRRRRREATFGAVAAVAATFVLVVVLVFVMLSSR